MVYDGDQDVSALKWAVLNTEYGVVLFALECVGYISTTFCTYVYKQEFM